MQRKEKIAQIIPATGWAAVYRDDPKDMPLDAVLCFALVDITEDGETWQEVRPMGPGDRFVEFVDTADNFSHVVYAPDRLRPGTK